jgi:hypothetical protein
MQQLAASAQLSSVGGLLEISKLLIERDEKAKQELKAERAEMRAEMESQRAEMRVQLEKQREALTPARPQEAISAEQLEALQARLEKLHGAKLLSDDELYACEGEESLLP